MKPKNRARFMVSLQQIENLLGLPVGSMIGVYQESPNLSSAPAWIVIEDPALPEVDPLAENRHIPTCKPHFAKTVHGMPVVLDWGVQPSPQESPAKTAGSGA